MRNQIKAARPGETVRRTLIRQLREALADLKDPCIDEIEIEIGDCTHSFELDADVGHEDDEEE